jgi:hypothetical protein
MSRESFLATCVRICSQVRTRAGPCKVTSRNVFCELFTPEEVMGQVCERCGAELRDHLAHHGEPTDLAHLQEAVFPGLAVTGVYCPEEVDTTKERP